MKTVLKIASVLFIAVIACSYIKTEMDKKELIDNHNQLIQKMRNDTRNFHPKQITLSDLDTEYKKLNSSN